MSSKPRGMALIVNNRRFTCGMKERIGTDKDAENLHRLFDWLGFSTKRKDDLTGKAMKKEFMVCGLIWYERALCQLTSLTAGSGRP